MKFKHVRHHRCHCRGGEASRCDDRLLGDSVSEPDGAATLRSDGAETVQTLGVILLMWVSADQKPFRPNDVAMAAHWPGIPRLRHPSVPEAGTCGCDKTVGPVRLVCILVFVWRR